MSSEAFGEDNEAGRTRNEVWGICSRRQELKRRRRRCGGRHSIRHPQHSELFLTVLYCHPMIRRPTANRRREIYSRLMCFCQTVSQRSVEYEGVGPSKFVRRRRVSEISRYLSLARKPFIRPQETGGGSNLNTYDMTVCSTMRGWALHNVTIHCMSARAASL
ncbi:hypothetical protein BC629DRAFT_1509938 [Irpex lacteus]|nr:hypothetical protein BC629DRAFT_1509938 [Irpex lacteus]